MKPYIIYARVSTDEQNIEQQIGALKDFCKLSGYKYRTYADIGISGKIEDRPEWTKALNKLATGNYKGLIVYNTDRVTRDGHYAYHFLNIFDKEDFGFISLTDSCDLNTEDGRFNFKIKCLLSEFELDKLKRRSRLGIEDRKETDKELKARGKEPKYYKGRMPGSKNR